MTAALYMTIKILRPSYEFASAIHDRWSALKKGRKIREGRRGKQKGATSEEAAPGFRKCGKKNGVP
jgi:hypothetical protein